MKHIWLFLGCFGPGIESKLQIAIRLNLISSTEYLVTRNFRHVPGGVHKIIVYLEGTYEKLHISKRKLIRQE